LAPPRENSLLPVRKEPVPDAKSKKDIGTSRNPDGTLFHPRNFHAPIGNQHQPYKTQKAGQTGQLRFQSYFACSAGTPFDQKERF
jgi:hypothetical protein